MKKKLIALVLAAAMGIATASPVSVQAADASTSSILGTNKGTVKLDKYGRAKFNGTLYGTEEIHYVKFTPKTAGRVKLVVNAKNQSVYSRIVEAYTEEALKDWSKWSRELNENYYLSKGTTYLIEVKTYWGGSKDTVNPYTASIQFSGAKESFPEDYPVQCDESRETAKTISLNKTYYGFNGMGNDVDWYKVKVVSSGQMKILTSSAANTTLDFDLTNSKGDGLYNNATLTKGTYYLRVWGRNSDGKGFGAYSFRFNDEKAAKPKATSITKLSKGKKSFKVCVKNVSAKGYQVQYSQKSNFKGSKTKSFSGTSCTVKGLKAKKKYYVRVRAYNNYEGDRVYSSWSSKKSVKVK